jgi:hypothetical protein
MLFDNIMLKGVSSSIVTAPIDSKPGALFDAEIVKELLEEAVDTSLELFVAWQFQLYVASFNPIIFSKENSAPELTALVLV